MANEYIRLLANDSYELTQNYTIWVEEAKELDYTFDGKYGPIPSDGTVSLAYYARDYVSNYGSVSSLPEENIKYLDAIWDSGIKVTSMNSMFYNCTGLTNLDLTRYDTSSVTDMGYMFYLCSGLSNLQLTNFDTSNVTNMYGMFCYCNNITSLDLSSFNTSKVIDMGSMFDSDSKLVTLDITGWDTSKVANFVMTFYGNSALQQITGGYIDLYTAASSSAGTMGGYWYMFDGCNSIKSVSIKLPSGVDASGFYNVSYIPNSSAVTFVS